METVLVQINNSKAYKLLEDLEELDILKVLNKSISSNANSVGKNESNIKKTMADFSGMLSESAYKSLKEHAQVARKEWERNIQLTPTLLLIILGISYPRRVKNS